MTFRSLHAASPSRSTLCIPSYLVFSSLDLAINMIVVSLSAECAPLAWTPLNRRYCAVRYEGTAPVSSNQLKRSCLVVVYRYATTDLNSTEVEDDFH